MKPLTRIQRAGLNFIRDSIERRQVSPSYAEIVEALGLSSSSQAHRIVHALVRHGHITMAPNSRRSIAIAPPHLTIPIPDDLDPALRRQARREGCSVEQFAIRILRKTVNVHERSSFDARETGARA